MNASKETPDENETAKTVGKKDGNGIKKIWKSFTSLREMNLLLIIVGTGIILTILTPDFLTSSNLKSTAVGMSADGIIAIGMTIALVCGGFDLSVGAVMALAGTTTGVLYLFGLNVWIASLCGIIAGILVGVINGFLIGRIGLNPMITTLGMMGVARGAADVITQGSPISFSSEPAAFAFLGQGGIFGIPFFVILFFVLAIIGDYMMRHSEPMRKVFYTGSNEKAAILSGIDTKKVKMYVFILAAFLSAISGVVSTARFSVADPTLGTSAEMRTMSAAVIGGASLSGGEGTIFGAVLGVILLNVINDGLVLLNVSVYWQDLVNGLILIGAITIDYVNHQRKLKDTRHTAKAA